MEMYNGAVKVAFANFVRSRKVIQWRKRTKLL
jgi:hypothetical protein